LRLTLPSEAAKFIKIAGKRFTARQATIPMVPPRRQKSGCAPGLLRWRSLKKGSVMGVSRAIILMLVAGLASGSALAQAPIVNKSTTAGGMTPVRLENRTDSLALDVAPHAPIPKFNTSPAQAASYGPAPLAVAKGEPLQLKTAASVRPAALATPYAGPAYQVEGRWYVPAHEPNYDEVGIASWYGPTFHGKASASGETFNENDLTAAHPTLPIPSLVRVTNLDNGKSVVVRLNDRGPFVDDRIIDMSKAAAAALDMRAKGTAKVRVQYVGPAPAEGGGAVSAAPAPVQAVRVDVVAKSLPPVAAKPAPAAQTGGYYVQAGAFSDLTNAHALRDRLSRSGPVAIEAANVNGSDIYRVMIGPWNDRDAADAARARLAGTGTNGMVVVRGR
jgi:rare lipoprotein A